MRAKGMFAEHQGLSQLDNFRMSIHAKKMQAEEFIRRFLLHVLPDGFQRIRYYGFLGNRYREQKLAHCRKLLSMPTPEHPPWQPPRTIGSAMKNSPALRCGSAQSVAKAACW